MERKFLLNLVRPKRNDNGVTSVVTSGAACAYVHIGSENVDELSFAFVTPLRAEHNGDCMLPESA